MASNGEAWVLENGGKCLLSKEIRHGGIHSTAGRTAHNMSSSSLRKKSDISLISKVRCNGIRLLLANLQEIFLGTKLSLLFIAIPIAIVAKYKNFGSVSLTSPSSPPLPPPLHIYIHTY